MDEAWALNWPGLLAGGLVGGLALAATAAGLRAIGFSRLPMMRYLGALVTARAGGAAAAVGLGVTLVLGLLYALLYAIAFPLLDWEYGSALSGAILGGMIGLVHGVGAGLLAPAADFLSRPVQRGDLPPLGRFGRSYGGAAAFSLVTAHVVFGAVFGWLYATVGAP